MGIGVEGTDVDFWISDDEGEIFDVGVSDVGRRGPQNGLPTGVLEHGIHGQLLRCRGHGRRFLVVEFFASESRLWPL